MSELADQCRSKAEAVANAFTAHPGRNGDGVLHVHTRSGVDVNIASIVFAVSDDGVAYADVHLAGEAEGGDPHFRIINPPTLVQDPQGEVQIDGRSYRPDPVAALAEAIARHGGGAR